MAQEFSQKFYQSKAWRACRKAYIASVFGLCEKCQAPGHILHHKKHLTPRNINDPWITLGWWNLEFLCQDCHNRAHGNAVTAEGLKFDNAGNLVSC